MWKEKYFKHWMEWIEIYFIPLHIFHTSHIPYIICFIICYVCWASPIPHPKEWFKVNVNWMFLLNIIYKIWWKFNHWSWLLNLQFSTFLLEAFWPFISFLQLLYPWFYLINMSINCPAHGNLIKDLTPRHGVAINLNHHQI